MSRNYEKLLNYTTFIIKKSCKIIQLISGSSFMHSTMGVIPEDFCKKSGESLHSSKNVSNFAALSARKGV